MGYFKEKDIEQKELLERAMKAITEIDDLQWMATIILDRFESRDSKSRDAALVTVGRLCERMKGLGDDVPDLICDYRKFNESVCTDNQPNMMMHEWNHASCQYNKPSKNWDDFVGKVKVNIKPYDALVNYDDLYESLKPKKGTPEPKKKISVKKKAKK